MRDFTLFYFFLLLNDCTRKYRMRVMILKIIFDDFRFFCFVQRATPVCRETAIIQNGTSKLYSQTCFHLFVNEWGFNYAIMIQWSQQSSALTTSISRWYPIMADEVFIYIWFRLFFCFCINKFKSLTFTLVGLSFIGPLWPLYENFFNIIRLFSVLLDYVAILFSSLKYFLWIFNDIWICIAYITILLNMTWSLWAMPKVKAYIQLKN